MSQWECVGVSQWERVKRSVSVGACVGVSHRSVLKGVSQWECVQECLTGVCEEECLSGSVCRSVSPECVGVSQWECVQESHRSV